MWHPDYNGSKGRQPVPSLTLLLPSASLASSTISDHRGTVVVSHEPVSNSHSDITENTNSIGGAIRESRLDRLDISQ
ncbi:hypothetical protein LY76DRAFT_397311 [Colletotrichum caudatum]|nr:hypothetical protein LY76DRAFT_397311 [Colletotrichum caudatum]